MLSTLYGVFLTCLALIPNVTAELCTESWSLERNSTKQIFVGFNNGTFPGRYTSLIWHWAGTALKGEWETTLWKSFESDNFLGSMAFRDGDGKVPVSLMWRLISGNLTWLTRSSALAETNWTIKVCNMPVWSYETDNLGNWTFTLGSIKLQGLQGEKIINNIEEIMTTNSENVTQNSYNSSV